MSTCVLKKPVTHILLHHTNFLMITLLVVHLYQFVRNTTDKHYTIIYTEFEISVNIS
jgi:hypothetical protein